MSSGALGPGSGNNGNSRFVLQLNLRGWSYMGVLITAGNLSVTSILSGHFVASKIQITISLNETFEVT